MSSVVYPVLGRIPESGECMTMAPWMFSTSLTQLKCIVGMVRRTGGRHIGLSRFMLGLVYCALLILSPQGITAYDQIRERFLLSR